jgi:hypothetical protein
MTAIRHTSVLGLAMLLAATTAVADTVITAQEVIFCRVVSADTNFVRLKLPEGGIRMLYTRDVHEIRLSDSDRVADLAAQLPQVRITLAPARHAGALDTLSRNASPTEMAARCREIEASLLDCGRSNDTVFDLLCEVDREQEALRRIWPQAASYLASGPCAGGLFGAVGGAIGDAIYPEDPMAFCQPGGGIVGYPVGCIIGYPVGVVIGKWRRASLIARHRDRVIDLVRRSNRATASPP